MRSIYLNQEPDRFPKMVTPQNYQDKNRARTFLHLLMVNLLVAFGLSACIPSQLEKSRSEAFRQYEIIVRWSQWDAAADFISPEFLAENPISRLELDRLRLFKVSQYTIRSVNVLDEGMTATQVVEIKMFNSTQGTERSIIDEQLWRFDESSQRWRLHSPLPDPTQGR
jgi:hypothetical protein